MKRLTWEQRGARDQLKSALRAHIQILPWWMENVIERPELRSYPDSLLNAARMNLATAETRFNKAFAFRGDGAPSPYDVGGTEEHQHTDQCCGEHDYHADPHVGCILR